jgi:ribosomal-protein-alanine N-acetyltransferase
MALREPREAPYRLRPAGPFDLDEVARIEAESFPVPWKRDFFASELVEPHRYIRVLAREDGSQPRIGGYLFAVSLYEEFHINKIATDPQVRKRGYGRWLLEDAVARARTMGSAAITLEVRIGNSAARQFYRSYAFTEAYRRRAYYQDGEDALVLVLPLRGAPTGG